MKKAVLLISFGVGVSLVALACGPDKPPMMPDSNDPLLDGIDAGPGPAGTGTNGTPAAPSFPAAAPTATVPAPKANGT